MTRTLGAAGAEVTTLGYAAMELRGRPRGPGDRCGGTASGRGGARRAGAVRARRRHADGRRLRWRRRAEGWQHPDDNVPSRWGHWYYDQQQIDGWDYDIGAQRVRTARAANKAAPLELITAWGLQPTDLTHSWNIAGPRVQGSGSLAAQPRSARPGGRHES